MAYEKKVKMLSRPTPSNDGSGVVEHDMEAVWIDDDTSERLLDHHTVCIPASELATIPTLPITQRPNAYRELIRQYAFYQKEPLRAPNLPSSWDNDVIEAWIVLYETWEDDFASANDDAVTYADMAGNFIEALGAFEGYPFAFTL